MSRVIAVTKKDNEKRHEVVMFDGEKVTIKAILEVKADGSERFGKEKEIKEKTFRKSYEIVEGDLSLVTATADPVAYVDVKEDSLPESFRSEEPAGGQEVMIQPHLPENMKSVTDPSRVKEDWEVAEEPVFGNGWDLKPTNTDPRLSNGSEVLKQDIVVNENSMRAGREKETKPFTPEPYFLRQSMISAYLQCPDKMYDTYENGYSEDTIFTMTGTAIHGIMEDFYKNPAAADVPALFEQWWTTHSTPEWDWYRDWKQMVTDYFDRQLRREQPQVLALEFEFQTGRDGLGEINGVPVSGTIDRIDRVDARTIKIVDYKTNFQPFTNAQLEESTQFMMYTAVVKRLKHIFGDFDRVICEYDMLRLGYTQEVEYDEETIETFEGYMKMIWTKILSGSDRAPKLNQYCSFCQKRSTCSLYEQQLNAPIAEIITENTDLESVAGEKERLGQIKKMIDNRLKEVDEQIKTAISNSGGAELEIGEHIWSAKASTRTSYPADAVIRTLALHDMVDVLPSIVNIGTTNMKKALADNKDVLQAIEGVAKTTYTAPSLSKKKKKK